jgi:hypothetical protein
MAVLARGFIFVAADLHFDVGVGEGIAAPAGMSRRAAFRGDDEIAVRRKVWSELDLGHALNSLSDE